MKTGMLWFRATSDFLDMNTFMNSDLSTEISRKFIKD